MQLSTNISVRADRPKPAVLNPDAEKLLSRLLVDVEFFSVVEVTSEIAPRRPEVNQCIVLYVLKGQGLLEWSDGKIALGEGMIAVIPSKLQTILRSHCRTEAANDDVPNRGASNHDDPAEAGGSLIVASSMVTASAGHGLGYFESLNHPLVEDSNDTLLALLLGGILTELETPGIGSKCILEAWMKQVLIVLLRRTLLHHKAVNPLHMTVASPSMAVVINTIQQSYAERLSIPGLARMVGMTSVGLTREFERVFGEGLLNYIQGVRLHQATSLLTQTDLPIKSIAASVGFASRSHFSRAFRKRQGEDPTTYRKMVMSA